MNNTLWAPTMSSLSKDACAMVSFIRATPLEPCLELQLHRTRTLLGLKIRLHDVQQIRVQRMTAAQLRLLLILAL
jgi:hypothetical protein